MEQPKFKFGDKIREGGQSPFTVKFISYSDEAQSYRYSDEAHKPWHLERNLKVYTEPKTSFTRGEVDQLIRKTVKLVQTEYRDRYSDSLERAEVVIKIMGDL